MSSTLSDDRLSECTQLAQLLKLLTIGDVQPLGSDPPWWVEGETIAITEEGYCEKLELLPPRWMNGSYFAFGEGAGQFTLFWQRGGQYFARHLSQAETDRFCRRSGTRLHQ